MSFLSYIFPRIIYRSSSKYSSDIRVLEDVGKLRLLVNGYEETGKYIDKILKRACDACKFSPATPIERMLLLGVGGGSLIRFFKKLYPHITIDAVDIDPVILEVSQTYFGLGNIKGLTLHNSDALKHVEENAKKKRNTYGIIVVDLYIGRSIPDFVWEQSFFEKINVLLAKNGSVFINVVHDGKCEEYVKKLRSTLQNMFTKTQEIIVDYNTFFLATK